MERILIVGAGPAGISTALFLAKKGVPSTVIDKAHFPREKICGDGLSGWVLRMLDRLDDTWAEGLIQEERRKTKDEGMGLGSWGIRFYAPNMKSITIPYTNKYHPERAPGIIIKRIHFDHFLFQKAKSTKLIEVIEGVEIKNARITSDEVILKGTENKTGKEVELSGELVVIADGAGSNLGQYLTGSKKEDQHHVTGIKTYYRGITETPGMKHPVELFFLKSLLPGYFWIFPLPNGEANVGLGMRTDVMKKKGLRLKDELYRCIEQTPELKVRFKDAEQIHPIQAWGLPVGSKKRKLSGQRFLLVGDAASLIDPFTGEGVGNAMNSGFHAAEHISEALQNHRFDEEFNQKYDRRVYSKLWKELQNSTLIQKLVMRPWLFSWVLNRAAGSRYLQDSFRKMVDSVEERDKLGSVGFYLKALIKK